jgi:hypothetical protein
MKEQALTLTLILALSISVLAGTLYFGTVQAATDVSGIISSDTTWTKAGSPYSLTGPVGVSEEANLTIEAGVTVNLNSYYIQVNGTLSARGSSTDQIYINDGSEGMDSRGYPIYPITFTPFSTYWNESAATGCIIENAVLNSTSMFISASPKIYNNSFVDSSIWISSSWSGSGANAFDASPTISNNTIIAAGGPYGIGTFYSSALIANNTILGYSAGIDMRSDTSTIVEGNLIVNNTDGIQLVVHQGPVSPIIRNNTIIDNSNGISLFRQFTAATSPVILYNNIYNNTNYNINSDVPDNINATLNWWGTIDTQAINQTIHDYYDDFTKGIVTFVPFLTEANPEAPAPEIPPIIPDFPSPLVISMLLATILVASIIFKRNVIAKKVKL